MRRLLIPAWLEALTLGGVALVCLAAAVIAISCLTALPHLHLAPGFIVLLVTVGAASILAAFGASYYRSLV
jgi:hypothetical protein